jgi:hypothetical protein
MLPQQQASITILQSYYRLDTSIITFYGDMARIDSVPMLGRPAMEEEAKATQVTSLQERGK